MFFICAAIYITGMIAFTFFGSSELQPWAIKPMKNGDVTDDLLLSMLNIIDIFFSY